MLSLFTAYFVTSLLFEGRIQNLVEEILIANGKKIIQTYQSTPSADLIPFIQNFSGISGTLLQLYDKDGKPLLDDKKISMHVDSIHIERVLAGGIVRNINTGEHYSSHIPHLPIVGLPFQVDRKPYALFLTVEKNPVEDEIMNSIHLMYIIILFFGSLLILVARKPDSSFDRSDQENGEREIRF
jgi:hypothetical protein